MECGSSFALPLWFLLLFLLLFLPLPRDKQQNQKPKHEKPKRQSKATAALHKGPKGERSIPEKICDLLADG
jgi:hypothetical protein